MRQRLQRHPKTVCITSSRNAIYRAFSTQHNIRWHTRTPSQLKANRRTKETTLSDFRRRGFAGALQALAQALEAKDPYTSGHSTRVSAYAGALASALGLAPDQVKDVRLAAELHDIGKIGVPELLLHKEGPLSTEEYRLVMEHIFIGERILRPLLGDHPMVLAAVRWHHERVDGLGFPDGLVGDEIPLAAKIITVSDTFDAMTTK
ncbi:MAG: HD-GYP domain-containing protein, partial [Acidiferrobacterales bacterium]